MINLLFSLSFIFLWQRVTCSELPDEWDQEHVGRNSWKNCTLSSYQPQWIRTMDLS